MSVSGPLSGLLLYLYCLQVAGVAGDFLAPVSSFFQFVTLVPLKEKSHLCNRKFLGSSYSGLNATAAGQTLDYVLNKFIVFFCPLHPQGKVFKRAES